MISRIDMPPQALFGFFDSVSLDLRTKRAPAFDSGLGLARTLRPLLGLGGLGQGFDPDHSGDATALLQASVCRPRDTPNNPRSRRPKARLCSAPILQSPMEVLPPAPSGGKHPLDPKIK
jgi:hypothetical protein